jgi:uncharacterized protein YlzI (FlbEa/FlbD family)
MMIKKCINNILFRLIEFIENKQYKNLKKDQSDPFKKIININFVDKEDLYVDSPNGWVKVEEINETQPYTIWYLRTNKGKELFCADNHMLYDDYGNLVFVQELKETDWIHTKDGFEYIDEIYSYKSSNCMVDLSVDSLDMNYYTNDILSHNTITAAITILHYALFNKDRGIMIVANKGDTVIEIIDKIKNIYKQLPFFLKNGIVNWNQKNIVFENGCRIKSSARSKEPAIGFTIDFLYMDEFAHIPPNIINHYYKAAIPTVSSMTDSKIVITSTPNGANLFKDLVVDSMLPKGHPDKNMYNFIKVLWYQVPDGKFDDGTNGTRMDPKLYFEKKQLDRLGIKLEDIFKFLDERGFKHAVRSEKSGTGDKQFIKVLYEKDKCNIDIIRRLKYNDIQLTNIFSITNWHENEIKLIGGEEAFNQEYECFTPDTLITTINGVKCIKDINVGDYVLTHSNRFRRVIGTMNKDFDGLINKVYTFGNNRPLKLTNEHPVRVCNDGLNHNWVNTVDLTVNDNLCYPKIKRKKIKIIEEDFAKVIAWYICEGCARKSQIFFTMHKNEILYAEEIKKTLSKYTKNKIKINIKDNYLNVIVNDVELVEFFIKNCGYGSDNKKIPFDLIATHEQVVYDTLILGDGHIIKDLYDGYTTTSYTLANDIQMLSHMLGYTCGITFGDKSGTQIKFGKEINFKKAHQLRINKNISTKTNKINKLKSYKYDVTTPIKKIDKEYYKGLIYNLEVEIDNSYVAEGRVVHNCQFIAGSKRVLSASKAQELNDRDIKYKYRKIDLLEDRLKFPYDELIWHPDFNLEDRFNHYWLTIIDTSEGLGADDSVMNLFRLCVRDDEWLKNNKIRNMYEAFYFKQTAVYNYNRISPDIELPELYYVLHFEFLDPNKCKTVLELNGPGAMFLSQIPNVFNQTNNFGTHVFVRYKHRKNDKRRKPGMKMTRDKKLLVKSYIDTLEEDRLYVDESQTLSQVENFIKVETPGGNYTYKADAGKDDITMTLVCGSTFFNTQDFKNMCNSLYKELPKYKQDLIDTALDINYNSEIASYGSVKKALSKTRNSTTRSGKYTGGGGRKKFMR